MEDLFHLSLVVGAQLLPDVHNYWFEVIVYILRSSRLGPNSISSWLGLLYFIRGFFFLSFFLLLLFSSFCFQLGSELFLFLLYLLLLLGFLLLSLHDNLEDPLLDLLFLLKLLRADSLYDLQHFLEDLLLISIAIDFVKDMEVISLALFRVKTELLKPILQSLSMLVEGYPLINKCGLTVVLLFHANQSLTKRGVRSKRGLILNVVDLLVDRVKPATKCSPHTLFPRAIYPNDSIQTASHEFLRRCLLCSRLNKQESLFYLTFSVNLVAFLWWHIAA